MSECPYPEHGKAKCGRCSGCCGAEEYCCATPDLAADAWKRDAEKAERECKRLRAEVQRIHCVLIDTRMEVNLLRAALAVFADLANWEWRRENDPPTWGGEGVPYQIAREALVRPAKPPVVLKVSEEGAPIKSGR